MIGFAAADSLVLPADQHHVRSSYLVMWFPSRGAIVIAVGLPQHLLVVKRALQVLFHHDMIGGAIAKTWRAQRKSSNHTLNGTKPLYLFFKPSRCPCPELQINIKEKLWNGDKSLQVIIRDVWLWVHAYWIQNHVSGGSADGRFEACVMSNNLKGLDFDFTPLVLLCFLLWYASIWRGSTNQPPPLDWC
jgi:hypothetical protein